MTRPHEQFRAWTSSVGCAYAAKHVLHISPEHVSRIRSGKYRPSLDLAARIEKAAGIPATSWVAKGRP